MYYARGMGDKISMHLCCCTLGVIKLAFFFVPLFSLEHGM